MAPNSKKLKIGDLLLEKNLITQEQLEKGIEEQKKIGGRIGNALIKLGFVDENELLRVISDQLSLPFIELEHYTIKPEIIKKIPERVARKFRILLIDKIQDYYLLGMADPTDVIALDEVKKFVFEKIRVAVVKESDVLKIIDQVYRRTDDIVSFAKELKQELTPTMNITVEESLSSDSAPVAKLLDSIFEDAVQVKASDIHIEPDKHGFRIRQRIDGVLHEQSMQGNEIVSALVLRVKLMANLNISERRLPQDGRIQLKMKNKNIDIRVSTMPVRHGESVVMRLLDQSQGLLSIDQIGMDKEILDKVKFLIQRPNGIFLVTGPTGSGKTTTLYAAIQQLNDESKNIITIEDPIEYTLPRINQVQVNNTINLTFANILRASLRQDPDIIMVGEMRDEETVEIGLRAAMTGHFVLSTLHTNDSISSAIRLIDMGAKGFLLASALRGIIAQRLVRKICDTCITDDVISDEHILWLKNIIGNYDLNWKFKKGLGCSRCNNTGYQGRMGLYELLEITGELADALRISDSQQFSQIARSNPKFQTITKLAFQAALDGKTSIYEMFKVSNDIN